MTMRDWLYDLWYEWILCRFWFRWWLIDYGDRVVVMKGSDPKHLAHMMPGGYRRESDALDTARFLMWLRQEHVHRAIKSVRQ
jgi:hypothetical protein